MIRVRWSVPIFIAAGLLAGPTAHGQAAADPLAAPRALVRQGRYADAVKALQPYLAARPGRRGTRVSDTEAELLLGAAYYGERDYAAAEAPLQAVLHARPADHEAVKLLGLDEYFLGHARRAIPYLAQAARWLPNQVDLRYLLTVCQIEAGDTAAARASAAAMLGVPAGTAAAHLALAQVLLRREMKLPAEQELRAALAQDPRLPLAHFMLGEIAIAQGRFAAAAAELRQEIALNPTYARAYYRLGDAEYRAADLTAAQAALARAIWLDPTFSGPYILQAKILLQQNDAALAERMLARAIGLDPNNYEAHYLRGRALAALHRDAAAQREFALSRQLRQPSPANSAVEVR